MRIENTDIYEDGHVVGKSSYFVFGSVPTREIPYVQYDELHQINWEAAVGENKESDNIKKIFKWKNYVPNSGTNTPRK